MMTANDYMRISTECRQAAEQVRRPKGDTYFELTELLSYHLGSAASKAQIVGEALAQVEKIAAEGKKP